MHLTLTQIHLSHIYIQHVSENMEKLQEDWLQPLQLPTYETVKKKNSSIQSCTVGAFFLTVCQTSPLGSLLRLHVNI